VNRLRGALKTWDGSCRVRGIMQKKQADMKWPMLNQNVNYRLSPPSREWDDETKARFQKRYVEVKEALATKYGGLVHGGMMDNEEALESCLHELLSTVAREFGLTLITTRR